MFEALKISTEVESLERAAHWLTLQGADTVADLRELPPGTYTCKELAESLGLPLLKAQRLLTALEGARALPSDQEASRFLSARAPYALGAHLPTLPQQPAAPVTPPSPPPICPDEST